MAVVDDAAPVERRGADGGGETRDIVAVVDLRALARDSGVLRPRQDRATPAHDVVELPPLCRGRQAVSEDAPCHEAVEDPRDRHD